MVKIPNKRLQSCKNYYYYYTAHVAAAQETTEEKKENSGIREELELDKKAHLVYL